LLAEAAPGGECRYVLIADLVSASDLAGGQQALAHPAVGGLVVHAEGVGCFAQVHSPSLDLPAAQAYCNLVCVFIWEARGVGDRLAAEPPRMSTRVLRGMRPGAQDLSLVSWRSSGGDAVSGEDTARSRGREEAAIQDQRGHHPLSHAVACGHWMRL
jgi:hypothetical protein